MMAKTVFYGNGVGLHDRIAGIQGSYAIALKELGQGAAPVIAVVRKNAFHLDKIFAVVSAAIGHPDGLDPFAPSPTASLADRFDQYLSRAVRQAKRLGIEIEMQDERLPVLLRNVQELAASCPETELLRLLGILCDTALVGPHWFVFETINACNSDCRYCNIHSPSRAPGREFLADRLPLEIFQSVIDDLAVMGVDGITILANGEPLLHPNFTDMAVSAKARGLLVNFFTNGLLLDGDVAEAIVAAGVDEAFVTVSAASEEGYLALHSKQKPGDYFRLLSQLSKLRDRKAREGAALPRVTGVHVICKANVHEVMDMARQAAQLGFARLRLALIRLDDHNRDLALSRGEIGMLQKQLPELESYCAAQGIELWDGYRFQLAHADDPEDWSGDVFVEEGCLIGWGLGLIKANADLSFCCVVKPIANLKDGKGFRELWNDAFYQEARIAAKDLKNSGGIVFTDGSALFTSACRHCDNHDINAMLHRRLRETGLDRYLGT